MLSPLSPSHQFLLGTAPSLINSAIAIHVLVIINHILGPGQDLPLIPQGPIFHLPCIQTVSHGAHFIRIFITSASTNNSKLVDDGKEAQRAGICQSGSREKTGGYEDIAVVDCEGRRCGGLLTGAPQGGPFEAVGQARLLVGPCHCQERAHEEGYQYNTHPLFVIESGC